MTAALIVIEIAAPQVSDDALSVLAAACTRAARDAECVLAKNASDQQPAAVAIVSLQSEDKMRVEVGVHQGDHDSWRTKDFSFLAADDALDRWRAIGFAIGTLAESDPPPDGKAASAAGAASATGPAGAAASPVARPTPTVAPARPDSGTRTGTRAAPTRTRSEADAETADNAESEAEADLDAKVETERDPRQPKGRAVGPLSIGAAAIFGPGLDRGPWRLGSELSAALALPRVPMFLSVSASAATRITGHAGEATVRWFDVSAGVGTPLLGPLWGSGLELRCAVLAEYFDVAASTFGRSDAMNRWTFGVQGALGGRLRVMPDLFLTTEVQAAGFSGSTEVRVSDAPDGTNASFRYLGSVGLRVLLR